MDMNLHRSRDMDENPYKPTSATISESAKVALHTTSIRNEAWRGFKFGARIGGTVMGLIVALLGLLIMTTDTVFNRISYLEIAERIGVLVFASFVTSMICGIAGGSIMMLAAIVRKLRLRIGVAKADLPTDILSSESLANKITTHDKTT